MPRKSPALDLDFKIYVDPSCLSEPMAGKTPATEMPPSPEEVLAEPAVVPETAEAPVVEETTKNAEEAAQDADTEEAQEEAQEPPAPEADATPPADAVEEEPTGEVQQHEQAVDSTPEADETPAGEDSPVPEPTPEAAAEPEPEAVPEPEAAEEPVVELEQPDAPLTKAAASEVETENAAEPETEHAAVDAAPEPEQKHTAEEEEVAPAGQQAAPDSEVLADPAPAEPERPQEVTEGTQHEETQVPAEDASAPEPHDAASSADEEERGRRTFVDGKTSLRTEALIQAAARAVVAKIEKRKSGEAVEQEEDEFDNSLLSTGSQDTYTLGDDTHTTHSPRPSSSRRESSDTHIRHIPSRSISSDDTGDSSSHHEPDDDVFSDRSARSSLCSLDAHDDDDVHTKTPQAKEHLSRRESYASTTTTTTTHHSMSPRAVSNFSTISGLSQYEDKHFIPTARETRMPFRTPSEIRAMQMASPTPSVFNGSSPRSAKRHLQQSVSRGLGSPTVSAQYSPKNRSTPPRFKPRKEEPAPLVLLHVTLLPLRWVWGDVVNGMDALVQGSKALALAPALEEEGTAAAAAAVESGLLPFEPSEQLKALRDAWRELQDRVGDTVLERGILLPHPQNDYEVLEERLLEALELPLRRRARILECGHYLGPANFHSLEEESEDEDGDEVSRDGKREGKRHWCNTCRNEIRYEALGPGKVFRVKVYASNGLMRAGAWEACWKEMERVDVEVEPIVDLAVQNELERLGALQLELEEIQRRQEMELEEQQRRQEMGLERTPESEVQAKRGVSPEQDLRAPSRQQAEAMSSRPPSSMQLAQSSTSLVRAATPNPYPAPSQPAVPIDTSEERRRRDEERLREIYGDAGPAPVPAQLPAPPAQPAGADHHHPQTQLYHQSHALTTAVQPQPQMALLTDGSVQSLHHRSQPQHQHHDAYNTRSPPPEDMYAPDPSRNHSGDRRDRTRGGTRPIVLDENSGFVELLMEAFKVLLRDPKNVAIIVLCVFVVVMIKRPGVAVENGLQPASVSSPVVPAVQVQMPVQGQGQEVYQFEARKEEVQVPVQVQSGVAEGEGSMASAATVDLQQSAPVPSHDLAVSVASSSPEAEVISVVEEEAAAVEEQTLEMGPGTDHEEAPQPDGSMVGEGNDDNVIADVCAPRGLEYPVTMVGEGPVFDEDESEGAVEPGEAENEPSFELDVAEEDEEQTVLKDAETDAAETTSAVEGCAAERSTEDAETSTGPNVEHQQAADDRCEADLDLDADADDSLPTPSSPSASTTSLFVPGPFVTERKTVRVFETVTETVRVSVVTQTETVSTVVTAVPQTVEETVYETETVRITVSVPVEEQMKKEKVKGGKGCKSKKGWF